MNKKKILKKLLKEIEILKNKKYGFLNAGFPRYKRLFGRDSLISAWQLLNIDPKITRNTLKILAKYQGKKVDPERDEEPGKILHEHQVGKNFHPKGFFPFPYYGSIDSTPLFFNFVCFLLLKN